MLNCVRVRMCACMCACVLEWVCACKHGCMHVQCVAMIIKEGIMNLGGSEIKGVVGREEGMNDVDAVFMYEALRKT